MHDTLFDFTSNKLYKHINKLGERLNQIRKPNQLEKPSKIEDFWDMGIFDFRLLQTDIIYIIHIYTTITVIGAFVQI